VSFRVLPNTDEEAKGLLREILDRLDRLENGGAIAGRVSFGPVIQIGDVLVTAATDGTSLTLTNVLTGDTRVLTIP
jgi:hypothetical protein